MFFDKEQRVKTDKGPMVISPNKIRMLRGNVNFVIDTNSSEAANSDKLLRKWTLISNLIAKGAAPFNNLTQESHDYVAKKMLIALDEKDPEQIIQRKPPEPVMPEGVQGTAGGEVPPQANQLNPELQAAMEESQAGGQVEAPREEEVPTE